MRTRTVDQNRQMWQAHARGESVPEWRLLGAPPRGVDADVVHEPPGLWLRPHLTVTGEVILAIHGGGFVSGSVSTHQWMFGHLAVESGMRVFAVEYGLVPESVFPSQLDAVTRAYLWLLSGGARRVAVMGDSCGALLALSLAVRLKRRGLPTPAALLLISAWTDFDALGDSYRTGSDPFFTPALVRELAAGYLAGTDPRDPVASPLTADLRGLPPTYLQVGAEEALRDDSRLLAARLRDAGVEVLVDEFAKQVHTFQMGAGRVAVADLAIRKGGQWLRSRA